MGLTGPRVFTGLGLAEALADARVAATEVRVAVAEAEVAAADEPAAGLARALLAGAGAELETAALDAGRLTSAELAAAERWCAEWLQAALRPASAAIMVAVTAVLGVRFMLHHRLGESRSEAIRGPICAK